MMIPLSIRWGLPFYEAINSEAAKEDMVMVMELHYSWAYPMILGIVQLL